MKVVIHDPAECFSLKENKDKCPKGWGTKRGEYQGPGSQDNDAVLKWISTNKPQCLLMLTPLRNYWTPLASQVEELDNPPTPMDLLLLIQHTPPCRVTFVLSPYHIDKDSTAWWRGCPPNKQTLYCIDLLMAQRKMRMGVLNGTIPSAVSNTGATSSTFLTSDPSLPTGRVSSAVFHLPK